MVNKKLIKKILLIFIGLVLIAIYITIKRDNKSNKKFYELQFNGIVKNKTYLKNKKSLFILVNNDWYGIIDYPLEKYIEKGDFIYKNDFSDCIFVKKNCSFIKKRIFCNSYAYLVRNKNVVRNLNSVIKNNKEQQKRE